MEQLIELLYAVLLMSCTYFAGRICCVLSFQTYGDGIQIGFSPVFIRFQINKKLIAIGWVIPLPFLFKYYDLDDNNRKIGLAKPVAIYAKIACWKRIVGTIGGSLLLLLSSFFLFTYDAYVYPNEYFAIEDVNQFGVYPSRLAKEIGFEQGDQLIQINGEEPKKFYEFLDLSYWFEDTCKVRVRRDGQFVDIIFPHDFLDRLYRDQDNVFLEPRTRFKVGKIYQERAPNCIGLLGGETILAVNGKPIGCREEWRDFAQSHIGRMATIKVIHEGAGKSPKLLETYIGERASFDFSVLTLTDLQPIKEQVSLLQACLMSIVQPFYILDDLVSGLIKSCQSVPFASSTFSSIIGAGKIFWQTWAKRDYWERLAIYMMLCGGMTLFPLPFMSGVAVMLLLREWIMKKPVNQYTFDKWQKIAQYMCLALLSVAFLFDVIGL